TPPVEGNVERARFFEAATQLVFGAARRSFAVFAIDDAHALDPETRDFVAYLARNHRLALAQDARAPKLLIVLAAAAAAAADTEAPQKTGPSSLGRVAEEIELREIALENLTRADVAAYLEAVFGSRRPSPRSTDRFFERTGGNPFLLDQLLRI